MIRGKSIVSPRSQCPSCHHMLAWYDLIPFFSWLLLCGQCRYCSAYISPLYPFIELFTPLVVIPLFFLVPTLYVPAYIFFFSALIITIRSDLEQMLISRLVTIFLIPVGLLLSSCGLLAIDFWGSLLGTLVGYGFLWCMATVFKMISGKDGIGQGDLELLAFIGSFTGIMGCWFSLLAGSIFGSVLGLMYMFMRGKKRGTKIPFGPFLALGAISYVLFQEYINMFLFGL